MKCIFSNMQKDKSIQKYIKEIFIKMREKYHKASKNLEGRNIKESFVLCKCATFVKFVCMCEVILGAYRKYKETAQFEVKELVKQIA